MIEGQGGQRAVPDIAQEQLCCTKGIETEPWYHLTDTLQRELVSSQPEDEEAREVSDLNQTPTI